MPVKSIIDIEVNDNQFKSFQESFEKYKKALDNMPGAWAATGEAVESTAATATILTAAVLAQNELIGKTAEQQSKVRAEVGKTTTAMTSLGRSTAKVFDTIKGITFSMLKWSAITGAFSTLAGAGGFFGYEALANSASRTRQSSLGLGVNPSQYLAANNAYARIGGAGDLMSTLANAKNDIGAKMLLATRLGINPNDITNKNPADLLSEVLPAIRNKYLSFPEAMRGQMSSAWGLDQMGLSGDQLRLLGNTPDSELGKMRGLYNKGVNEIGASSKEEEKYQTFLAKMGIAGDKLQNTLIDKLSDLTGPLSDVVGAFTDLAKNALGSEGFKEGLKSFAKWIEDFSKTLSDPKTAVIVTTFVDDIGKIVVGLDHAVRWIAAHIPGAADYLPDGGKPVQGPPIPPGFGVPVPGGDNTPYGAGFASHIAYTTGGRSGRFNRIENAFGLPGGLLDSVWNAESGRGRNTLSSAGAMGDFQIMPATAKGYGVNPWDRGQSAAFAGWDYARLLKMFGGDLSKAAAGYNWGEKNVKGAIKKYGDRWLDHAPTETRNYVAKIQGGVNSFQAQPGQGITIRILNATGGNLVNASASLGAQGVGA